MKCFVKKLAFSLATCTSITSCLNAEEEFRKSYVTQLKYWEQQPIRYKMSIDIINEKSIAITVIIPSKTSFYRTFKIDGNTDFNLCLRWMKYINQDCRSVDLFILPNVVEYEEYNVRVPLILCYSKNSICSIFIKDNPIWKFVDEYLQKYCSKNWCTKDICEEKTVKCEHETGDFYGKSFISWICYCVYNSV